MTPHRLAPAPSTGLAPVCVRLRFAPTAPLPPLTSDLCTLPSPQPSVSVRARPCPSVQGSGFRIQGSGKNPRPPLGSFPPPPSPPIAPHRPSSPACVPSLTSDLCFLTSFPEPRTLNPSPLPYHRISIPPPRTQRAKKYCRAVPAVRRTWCRGKFLLHWAGSLTRKLKFPHRPIAAPSVPYARPRLPSRPLPQTPSPCPPSAGRGAEAFVWILPGSHAKITAEFFDDAAFPLPPPAFRLAPLPPLRCLTLAPAAPSRLQQGPNINSAACPPSAGRGVEDFFCPLGRGCCAKIRRLFFEDGALMPTLAGLMSASGRQRRARTKKRPLVFAPPQCKRNPLFFSPRPTHHLTHPPHRPATYTNSASTELLTNNAPSANRTRSGVTTSPPASAARAISAPRNAS